VAHVVVILSTISVKEYTQEWFMLLLLLNCLPLFSNVLQRNGSCCCYIIYHYSLMFYRGAVHVVVAILSTITVYGLTEEWFMLLRLVLLYIITV
jgi:hypothetical protein